MRLIVLFCLLLLSASSCVLRPLKPGRSEILLSTNFSARMIQSENPATPSAQKFDEVAETVSFFPNAAPSAPSEVRNKTVRHADTTVGAAQKDTARELAAKLKSLSFLIYIGVFLFIFGVATLAWPPLRLLVGSVTTSVMTMGAGLALTVLPVLVVGHELLILGVSAGVAGFWFFAHRHGKVSATAKIYSDLFHKSSSSSAPAK